jgi:sigma-B regulation protein RsbU (phosphoserine phosphatase)
MMAHGSIRRRLLFWVIGVTSLLLLAIVLWSTLSGRARIIAETQVKTAFLAEGGAARVDRRLAPLRGLLQGMATAIEAARFELPFARVRGMIEQAMGEHAEIFGMCLAIDPAMPMPADWRDRSAYWFRGRAAIAYTDLAGPGNAHTGEDWFRVPLRTGAVYWSEPYVEAAADQLMVTCSVPLRLRATGAVDRAKPPAVVGVITFDLAIDWLDALLADLPYGTDGYGFLMSRKGTYIAHPLSELVAKESVFSIAAARGDANLEELGRQMTSGVPGLRSWRSFRSHTDCWLAYTPLQTADWIMGAIVSKEDLNHELARLLRSQAAIGGIGLLVLIAAVVAIARSITEPVERLRDAANELAGGNLDLVLPAARGGDEVAQLTRAIAEMRDRLQDYIRTLRASTAARERMQSELRIAHEIQMGLVPKTFPAFPTRQDLDLYAILEPAREVGGDFYDFFQIDDDHLVIAIGDVSDKGVPAALFMAVTRSFLRSFFRGDGPRDPAEVLTRVNAELANGNDACMFVTLFCAVVRLSDGAVTYANAGHNPPLLRLADGQHRFISEPSGPVAGALATVSYSSGRCTLPADAMLVLYTDGVTEAMDPAGQWYGEERMAACISAQPTSMSCEALVHRLLAGLRAFTRGADQSDDITMLLLKRCPAATRQDHAISLQFGNHARDLELALDELETRIAAFAPALAGVARLVLEEMGTNIIKFGYDDSAPHLVRVRFLPGPPAEMIIEDDGHPFNPLVDAPQPDLQAALPDRLLGGLGIHMVRTMTASQSYQRKEGRNRFAVTFQELAAE